MADGFGKSAYEAEKDLAAWEELQKALLAALMDIGKGFLPGLTVDKVTGLTVEDKKKSPEIPPGLEIEEKKPIQPQQEQEGLLYGRGVNRLTPEHVKAIAAIMRSRKNDSVIGAENLIIKFNGKPIYETDEQGKIILHTPIAKELATRIAALEPAQLPAQAVAIPPAQNVGNTVEGEKTNNQINEPNVKLPHPLAAQRVADISNAINPPVTSNPESQLPSNDLPGIEDASYNPGDFFDEMETEPISEPAPKFPHIDRVTQQANGIKNRAVNDITTVKNTAVDYLKGEIPLSINKLQAITNIVEIVGRYMDFFQKTALGMIPGEDQRLAAGINQSVDAINNLFADLGNEEEQIEQGLSQQEDMETVKSLFSIYAINGAENPDNALEGRLDFPDGAQLINVMNSKGTGTLSLRKNGVTTEIGKHSVKSNRYYAGKNIGNIKNQLKELTSYIDLKTGRVPQTTQQQGKATRPPNTVVKPVIKQNLPDQSIVQLTSIEAEEQLIARIVLEPKALSQSVAAGVTDKTFSIPVYQEAFKAAQQISSEGKFADMATVINRMVGNEKLKGIDVQNNIANAAARYDPGPTQPIAEILINKQLRRDAAQSAGLIKVIANSQESIKDVTQQSIKIIDLAKSSSLEYRPAIAAESGMTKDLNSERQVVGALFQFKNGYNNFAKVGVTAQSFTNPLHRAIYQAASELHHLGQGINLLAIKDRLPEDAKLEAVQISESTFITTTLSQSAQTLVECDQRRELIKIADKLESVAYDPNVSRASLLSTLDESQEMIAANSDRVPKLQEATIKENPVLAETKAPSPSPGRN